MANINIKFNNKDYLLSCDDGQEEDLKNLTKFLDKKYSTLREKLGNIGENKLLLITAITTMDEYFETKKKIDEKFNELRSLTEKFKELKSLVYEYKEKKKNEINKDIWKKGKDSGSPKVHAAILTERIKNLNDHFKNHSKDFSTRRGLLTLVGKRRRVLDYIKNKNEENYLKVIEALGLRK